MKQRQKFLVSIVSISLIIGSLLNFSNANPTPDPAPGSYCYVDFSYPCGTCTPIVDVYWMGKLDDGWYNYSSYTKDDYSPYSFSGSSANCSLSYSFVHLKCKAVLKNWSDDPNCTNITKYSPWVGDSTGILTVSASIDFDDDYPFACLN